MTGDRAGDARPTLLVGISNPETATRLIGLAGDVADTTEADVLLTHVVTVASQIGLTTGRSSPEVVRARDFLQGVIRESRSEGVAARGLIEVARSVEDGLLSASQSHGAETILVGYSDRRSLAGTAPQDEERFDRTIHRVARKADAGVLVAKFRRESRRRIAVPVAVGTPLGLTRRLCAALAGKASADTTFVHVAEPGVSLEEVRNTISAQLDAAGLLDKGRLEIYTSDVVVDGVVAAVANHDLVILTPSERPGLLDRVYSSRGEKIAERVSASAILVWGSGGDG